MKNRILLSLALLATTLTGHLDAISAHKLNEIVTTTPNPFGYDLHFTMRPCEKSEAELLICMHGMGSSYALADIMKNNSAIPYHIVSFNFPEYGAVKTSMKTTYGTFDELAPALFVLKKCIVDGGADKVHLYGFSSGGGVIINTLAILNSNRYDKALQTLGIGEQEKKKILQSIQQGSVILEVPLRSFDEIAEVFGGRDFQLLAQRARQNGMTPIQNLKGLQGLSLNTFVYFAKPDEALGNRDDKKYIQLLQNANQNGQTVAIIGNTAGHTSYHPELWDAYQKFVKDRS